jgi:hypothetical protein
MKPKFFAVFLVLYAMATTNSFSQAKEGSWQLGASGAPLFDLSSSGLNERGDV